MKLTLHGHDDRYAVEQLQLSLFPDGTEGEAVSSLHRGRIWLTAVTKITVNGITAAATRRIRTADETVRLRRRALQQSYYLAAKQLLPVTPPWGALAGVRPTKITTKHLLEGGTPKSADKLLRDGRIRLKDCRSAKGKTYNATVLLSTEADGRSKFSLEFEGGR